MLFAEISGKCHNVFFERICAARPPQLGRSASKSAREMIYMKKRSFTAFATAVLFGILSLVFPSAAEQQKRTVTVAYIDYNNFVCEQGDGEVTGYGAEMMKLISDYAGWECDFVYFPWVEAYEKVKNGEIDFYLAARRSEERERYFDFSTYKLFDEVMNLYVTQDKLIAYEDFTQFDGMTVGVLENSDEMNYFTEYAKKNNFSFTFREYATNSSVVEALKKGEVDAAGIVNYATPDDVCIIGNFGIAPAYLMSRDGSELMKEFRSAHIKAYTNDPEFFEKLSHKYYNTSVNIMFSTEEQRYIAENGSIRVGMIQNEEPLTYINADGEADGITVGIMDELSRKSGLAFEYEIFSAETALEALKNGDTDVIAGVVRSDFSENEALSGAVYGNLYESTLVFAGLITEFSAESSLTVVVPDKLGKAKDFLSANYPNFCFISCDTTAAGLDLINSGRADIIIQNMFCLRQLLLNPRYSRLEIFPTYSYDERIMYSVLSENKIISSILDKSLVAMGNAGVNEKIIESTVLKEGSLGLDDFLYVYGTQITLIAVLVLSCVTLLIIVLIFRQRTNRLLRANNSLLSSAIEHAESASKAKTQFLAHVSHEIRTPMNSIIGLVALARADDDCSRKQEDYLSRIDISSKLMLGLLNDILDMSAIEGGKMRIDNNPFDFRCLIFELSTVLHQQAIQKNIALKIHSEGILDKRLRGDVLRVNQVLLNIMSNAIKFTPNGGRVVLDVKQLERDDDKITIQFAISDTGVGMGDDMMKRLFEPFEQENASTAHFYGGSGLGLSIAKELTTLMGGTITARSRVGWGSVFTVVIPFEVISEENENIKPDFSTIHVLVADSDRITCEYTEKLLRRFGMSGNYAYDEETMFKLLNEATEDDNPYGLFLIDRSFSKNDSLGIIKRVRKQYGGGMTILLLSAYDTDRISSDGIGAGADYVLHKPLFQSDLFNVLIETENSREYRRIQFGEIPAPKFDFSGKKVLIAEDVAINLMVASELLKNVGFTTVGAENGKLALERYMTSSENEFDCIMLDINMPEMDGYQVARSIRAAGRGDSAGIQIFAMTANAFSADEDSAIEAGMNGHISKPIDTAVLYKTLYNSIFGNKA